MTQDVPSCYSARAILQRRFCDRYIGFLPRQLSVDHEITRRTPKTGGGPFGAAPCFRVLY